jgi:hypothetical protein
LRSPGAFETCPVCFWQDDGQGNIDADDVRDGPNGQISLTRARENYAEFGACHYAHRQSVRTPREDE